MTAEEKGIGAAQPAKEEIKNHGDKLQKQVADAAGKQSTPADSETGTQTSPSDASSGAAG